MQDHFHSVAIRTELQPPCDEYQFGHVLASVSSVENTIGTTFRATIGQHESIELLHRVAAVCLADLLKISGRWYGGKDAADGSRFVFVCLPDSVSDECLFRSHLTLDADTRSYFTRWHRLRAKVQHRCTDTTCNACDPYRTNGEVSS